MKSLIFECSYKYGRYYHWSLVVQDELCFTTSHFFSPLLSILIAYFVKCSQIMRLMNGFVLQ